MFLKLKGWSNRSSAGRNHVDLQNSKNVKRALFVNSLNRWTVYEKMEEGGGVRGRGANMCFGNKQILKCSALENSSQDVTHYSSQAKHPHYITSIDMTVCSPVRKRDRPSKEHLANSSTFSAGRQHKHKHFHALSQDWNIKLFVFTHTHAGDEAESEG